MVGYSFDLTVPGSSGVQHSCVSGCSRPFSGPTTVTAGYQTQYYLTMQANPTDGGTVSPSSNWESQGNTVTISATQNTAWQFTGWTGTGSGSCSGTCTSVTVNGPITETANFQTTTFTVTFDTNPPSFPGASSAGLISACSGTFTNGQSSTGCGSSFLATANERSPLADT